MNRTPIDWVKNPDGTQGYTWNPITGCLNGCEYCYARKLANGRLWSRYIANHNLAPSAKGICETAPDGIVKVSGDYLNPFYPRFWEDRFKEQFGDFLMGATPKGIFVCDMSDLFGIGIPEEWTKRILEKISQSWYKEHRFYLLTKQPQNLIKFSPFPDNCWVGVTATTDDMLSSAILYLHNIKAKVKYISFEPLLEPMKDLSFTLKYSHIADWVIIGAQTKPYKPPKIEWVEEIVQACDKAGVPVFLKDNLTPMLKKVDYILPTNIAMGAYLRQEMPEGK